MNIKRCRLNPIITCRDIVPSHENFEVTGVFNPGAVVYNNEIVLAARVSEKVKSSDQNIINVPIANEKENSIDVASIDIRDKRYDFTDPRVIKRQESHSDFEYLTSMSHIRIAKSSDGVNFKIDENPSIFPGDKYESFGIEDPRITRIDQSYYITYSAVSKYGIVVKLVKTQDFKSYKSLGNIFSTENKDVVIFPERIKEKYFALTRPVSKSTGKPVIWISESQNLAEWGNHRVLASTRDNIWDSCKIGAGVPPIKTKEGWLELYHGVDECGKYSMGALLLDLKDPGKVIKRSLLPIMEPCEEYEKNGFFENVIFPCGAVEFNEKLYIYYGAGDNSIALAISSIDDILNSI